MASVRDLNMCLMISSTAGLALSIYAYAVELKSEMDEEYSAMCDISEYVSCTKAFKSSYGKGFGIFPEGSILHKPNSLFGCFFYSLMIVLAHSSSEVLTQLSLVSIILSNFASVYFAYILYFILYDFCIVCVSTYVVNFANLIITYLKLNKLKELHPKVE